MWPLDLRDEAGGQIHDSAPAFHCLLCGDLVDPVILTNRNRVTAAHNLRIGRTRFHRKVVYVS
jgi:hypothetical protein